MILKFSDFKKPLKVVNYQSFKKADDNFHMFLGQQLRDNNFGLLLHEHIFLGLFSGESKKLF